jgi:hypothetical protein
MPGVFHRPRCGRGKGGEFMQKSVRYYITTADAEPTVRSVRVAMRAAQLAERGDASASGADESLPERRRFAPGRVRRLVEGAIVKRGQRH